METKLSSSTVPVLVLLLSFIAQRGKMCDLYSSSNLIFDFDGLFGGCDLHSSATYALANTVH